MLEKITKSQERYGDMVQALNRLYWDSEISPEEIVARLEQFGAECFRLAKFIQGNIDELASRHRTTDEAEAVGQPCPRCAGSGRLKEGYNLHTCPSCDGSGQR